MPGRPTHRSRRIACVWLPDWPVQRRRLAEPLLARRPLVIGAADSRGERVAALSDEARRLGVRPGMTVSEAEALSGHGVLAVAPHEPGADRRALQRLAGGCERYSPVVALEDAPEPSALLLDLTGLAPLWRTEARLLAALVGHCRQQRLSAQIAAAPTVGLAIALARHEVAPGGAAVTVDNSVCRERAEGLPVESLRLDAGTLERLDALGVRQLSQLLVLPSDGLPARFGRLLSKRLAQLTGEADEPLVSFRSAPPLAARWPFETAVSSYEPLRRAVDELIARLCAVMRRRRCGALRGLVVYEFADGGEHQRIVLRLFRPTNSARELSELVALNAGGLRPRGAVDAVGVVIGSTAPVERRQRRLFHDDPRDDPHELALLVNRLATRCGAQRVTRVLKRRSVLPERAYGLSPAVDEPGREFPLADALRERTRRRPLLLDAAGEPARVESDPHGAPVRVEHGGWRRVTRCWGPERIETGWWRGASVRRDAYWVELAGGARLWLVCDLASGQWRYSGRS
ncbi:DNA polymerase Y family protein [Botrimarina sp.]|uniref:DNA polymerase Y family protein n=1 Tax=Botrimarina sp. TaxID=2795802 RepID=UPI0032EE56FF